MDTKKRRYNQRYYKRNRKKILAYRKMWCKANAEKLREHKKVWRCKNPEKVKAYNKKYYLEHLYKPRYCIICEKKIEDKGRKYCEECRTYRLFPNQYREKSINVLGTRIFIGDYDKENAEKMLSQLINKKIKEIIQNDAKM